MKLFKSIILMATLLASFSYAQAYEFCSVELYERASIDFSVYAICDGETVYKNEYFKAGYLTEFTKAMSKALKLETDFRVIQCTVKTEGSNERICVIGRSNK